MTSFRTVTLGEICSFKYGEMPQRSVRVSDGYPIFSGYRVVGWASRFHYSSREIIVVARGVGGTGDVKWSPANCFLTNLAIAILVTSPEVDKSFLYYRLASTKLWELRTGSAQAQITIDRLRQYQVALPPIATQRKIAAILSAYDDLIENNNRRINLLEEMAQRIYHEWFMEFRYPGHEDVPSVDSEWGPIPQGWSVGTLDDACIRITDGSHHSPATTTVGMPMASVKDMTRRSLDIPNCRLISVEDYESLVRQDCRPRARDILVSKDGANFLKHVFPMFADSVAVLLSSVALLRPSDVTSPTFLSLSLREPQNKARLKGFVSGAAIPRVVLKDFKKHRLVLPPQPIQERFDEVCEPLLRQAVTRELICATLRRTRDLLLPRLISGEVDVTDLDIEMAEDAA